MPIVKAGSEFLVNQTTQGNQRNPAIATAPDGNITIAWTEGSGSALVNYRVKYRQFDVNGNPINNEQTAIEGYTYSPSVVVGPTGTTTIAATYNLGTSNYPDIIGFSRTADGIQGTRDINTYRPSRQSNPRIAQNKSGDYVITWESAGQDGSGYGIYAQRFNASGNPQGPEFRVNTTTENDQSRPSVAIDDNGNFVVAWQSFGQDGSDYGIYAQRFNASGSPQGSEFQVNTTTEGGQLAPAIAMQPNGDFIITWDGLNGATSYDIFARRFSASGAPLSGEILVNTYTAGTQSAPAIATDEFGNFVITWTSDGQDGSDYGVYARRFRPNGTPLSNEFQVNTFTEDDQEYPAIAMQPGGDFVITWESSGQDGDGEGVYAQRFELTSTVVFKDPSIQVGEDGGRARIVLARQNELHLTTQVRLDVTGGTATRGQDYTFAAPRTITFNPGETRKVVNIPIRQDNLIEGNETIQLRLESVSRATLNQRRTTTVTIVDDDLPRFPGSVGKKLVVGTHQAERLAGTGAAEMLIGLRGNDRLVAGGGNDILVGVDPNSRTPGRNEIDIMTGGAGRDLFVLGNERYVFYNSGKRNNLGLQDYAVIKDFNRSEDKILLHGKASDYSLGASPQGVQRGTAIFLKTPGINNELIAIVQGQTDNLRLNSNAFQFVG